MLPCTVVLGVEVQLSLCMPWRHLGDVEVRSVEQKSIGLKFSKSRTGSHVTYSCHHNSSRFTFPIFAHSWRFSVFHSCLKSVGRELPKAENWPGRDNTVINPELSGGRIPLPFHSYSHHHHKHQGLAPLIRSVSWVTTALTNVSSVFQLFSFLVHYSDMISKGFGFVAFFASVKASSVCIHLSCPVCM